MTLNCSTNPSAYLALSAVKLRQSLSSDHQIPCLVQHTQCFAGSSSQINWKGPCVVILEVKQSLRSSHFSCGTFRRNNVKPLTNIVAVLQRAEKRPWTCCPLQVVAVETVETFPGTLKERACTHFTVLLRSDVNFWSCRLRLIGDTEIPRIPSDGTVDTHQSNLFKASMSILIRSLMLHANRAPLVSFLAFGLEPLYTTYVHLQLRTNNAPAQAVRHLHIHRGSPEALQHCVTSSSCQDVLKQS
jgi:hypothetical protein